MLLDLHAKGGREIGVDTLLSRLRVRSPLEISRILATPETAGCVPVFRSGKTYNTQRLN